MFWLNSDNQLIARDEGSGLVLVECDGCPCDESGSGPDSGTGSGTGGESGTGPDTGTGTGPPETGTGTGPDTGTGTSGGDSYLTTNCDGDDPGPTIKFLDSMGNPISGYPTAGIIGKAIFYEDVCYVITATVTSGGTVWTDTFYDSCAACRTNHLWYAVVECAGDTGEFTGTGDDQVWITQADYITNVAGRAFKIGDFCLYVDTSNSTTIRPTHVITAADIDSYAADCPTCLHGANCSNCYFGPTSYANLTLVSAVDAGGNTYTLSGAVPNLPLFRTGCLWSTAETDLDLSGLTLTITHTAPGGDGLSETQPVTQIDVNYSGVNTFSILVGTTADYLRFIGTFTGTCSGFSSGGVTASVIQ